MSNVKRLIDTFVPQFEAAVRADALASITAQLGGLEPTRPILSNKELSDIASYVGPARGGTKPARKSAPGAKRTPAEFEAVQKSILTFLGTTSPASAEQIKAGLGVELAAISLPIAKLLATKTIKKTGQKRATRYSVR